MPKYVVDQHGDRPTPDFRNLKASGAVGYIHKVSEGQTFRDGKAKARLAAARAAGLKVGVYHFARPDLHPTTLGAQTEARGFVNAARAAGYQGKANDIRPVLDYERPHGGLTSQVAWIRAFNKVVKSQLGSYPLFYTYYYLARDLGTAMGGKPVGSGLWLAGHPIGQGITVPKPWKRIYLYQRVLRSFGNYHNAIDVSTPQTIFGLLPVLVHPVRATISPLTYWNPFKG